MRFLQRLRCLLISKQPPAFEVTIRMAHHWGPWSVVTGTVPNTYIGANKQDYQQRVCRTCTLIQRADLSGNRECGR